MAAGAVAVGGNEGRWKAEVRPWGVAVLVFVVFENAGDGVAVDAFGKYGGVDGFDVGGRIGGSDGSGLVSGGRI